MKPTVIANAANATMDPNNSTGGSGSGNGITIPINREYTNGGGVGQNNSPHHHQTHFHNAAPFVDDNNFGSPKTHNLRHQYPPTQPQHQQIPAHFQQQGFGFEPDLDIDMDMFPRSRLGRNVHEDPFANFGGSHFGFPQFGSMGRRRAAGGGNSDRLGNDDFFNRLPSEFRQYIPEGFGTTRRGGSNTNPPSHQQYTQNHPSQPPPQQQQYYPQGGYAPSSANENYGPQSPTKKLCDAAIQTDEVDGVVRSNSQQGQHADTLNQHGLRNTMDMGVKSTIETEAPGARSQSAPPTEQQQQQQHQQQQFIPPTSVAGHQQQFGTQTTPPVQGGVGGHRSYYAPHQQAHPQQKQPTPPPPQTPGGTNIRTIPIFVEGRSEPIINSHKEIPNQNAPSSASASTRSFTPNQHQQQPQQQQHPSPQQQHPQHQQRPTPINTQQKPNEQQQQQNTAGVPPQTPHTLDSINKIQDIQRDVLDLMSKVEKFTGTRQEKEYIYLDEMLTRNLLKLDTIDTNGKDSIRLARKEAIKCIQASINVLEAKATENAKRQSGGDNGAANKNENVNESANESANTEASGAAEAQATATAAAGQEPIPLPPPPAVATNEQQATEAETQPGEVNNEEGKATNPAVDNKKAAETSEVAAETSIKTES